MTRYDDPMFRIAITLSDVEFDQLELACECADLESELNHFDPYYGPIEHDQMGIHERG